MKIGIMGGTFDPIHLAHLEMAHAAKEQKELEQVWFMPSKIPPHKRERKITAENLRFHWVELAVRGKEGFFASDFELKHPGITYTAETLERLKRKYPEYCFFFLLGADSLFDFENWYHPEKILSYAEILSFCRNGISMKKMKEQASYLIERYGGSIEVLQMQEMAVSSSMLREKIVNGESVEEYLPEALWQEVPEMKENYREEQLL